MAQWSVHVSRGDLFNKSGHHSLPPDSYTVFARPHKHRTLAGSRCMEFSRTQRESKVNVLQTTEWAGGWVLTATRGHAFLSIQNPLHMQKRGSMFLRNKNNQTLLSYPRLLLPLPCINQPLELTMTAQEKERQRNSMVLFPFSLSFHKPRLIDCANWDVK